MRLAQVILKGCLTLLACVLTHAIILGVTPDFYNVYVVKIGGYSGGYTTTNYLLGIRYAIFLIVIYCFWLLYLPAFAIYRIVADFFKIDNYSGHIILAAIVGIAYALPFIVFHTYLKEGGNTTAIPWITIPSASAIGAVYGFLYRSWWHKCQ